MPRPKTSQSTIARRAELGGQLRKEREAAALSQQQLANFLHIPKRDLQRFEAGEKSIPAELLPEICRGLAITPARLLGVHTPAILAAVA